MAKLEVARRVLRAAPTVYTVLVLAGFALGYLAFNLFWGQPKVGIITVPATYLYSESVRSIKEMLAYAEQDRSIKAVAIDWTSGGGGASESEDLFLSVLQLRQKKPVVISVGWMAASGGYMVAVASNYLYVKGSSYVGNVGAIMWVPSPEKPSETFIPTGPFKAAGATRRTYIGMLEMVKEAFVQIVLSQRGDRLSISPQQLAEGRIYLGMEAVRLGLADEIGTMEDAIRKAAKLAGIRNYGVVDINSAVERGGTELYLGPAAEPSPSQLQDRYHRIDYLYLEPR
ncbi:MAG TPA: S49 family peptidase [Dehalococcoidia bacterium]|nr:S49 family peptidase [Dehalococcoidia bacterium]